MLVVEGVGIVVEDESNVNTGVRDVTGGSWELETANVEKRKIKSNNSFVKYLQD